MKIAVGIALALLATVGHVGAAHAARPATAAELAGLRAGIRVDTNLSDLWFSRLPANPFETRLRAEHDLRSGCKLPEVG